MWTLIHIPTCGEGVCTRGVLTGPGYTVSLQQWQVRDPSCPSVQVGHGSLMLSAFSYSTGLLKAMGEAGFLLLRFNTRSCLIRGTSYSPLIGRPDSTQMRPGFSTVNGHVLKRSTTERPFQTHKRPGECSQVVPSRNPPAIQATGKVICFSKKSSLLLKPSGLITARNTADNPRKIAPAYAWEQAILLMC